MTDNGHCDSARHENEVEATSTVQFPRSASDRVNSYCDTCIRHLLEMNVSFTGVSDHA